MADRLQILIFTVDLIFADILQRVLEQKNKNYKFYVYNSFSEAKNISQSDKINLILVDDIIVGTSGFELISFLRLNRKIICPIIYFGTSEHNGEREAILTGANYFINKPFKPDEVVSIIRKLHK